MTLQIYGDSVSGNCLKVKWTARKLGIPYRWIQTDVMKAETRTPEFLAMNPAGQVPLAVLPDGRPLAQSNAIILHLAEGSDLIPRDAYARAKMLEWLFWEQYSHEPYIAVARFHRRLMGKPASEIEPRLMERGAGALARLEQQLGATPFLAGETLSLADVALVAYTRVAHEGGFDLDGYPAVKAWVGRVEAELGIDD
ncbi:MAG TPA: glutathione S-transferase family protein [Caulobacteraceae bacterium]|jgi:glutathione S-transferase